jgi:hypothetical protein
MMMPRLRLYLLLLLGAAGGLRAPAAPDLTNWEHVKVAPMKTSIYVGSVRLTTGTFERQGSTLAATYEAKVVPWFFWGETGRITITLADADLANIARGETAEVTGEAFNHKNKPRKVTGHVQPVSATSGKIKVRIMADGIELIFNSTYEFLAAKPADRPTVTPPSGK